MRLPPRAQTRAAFQAKERQRHVRCRVHEWQQRIRADQECGEAQGVFPVTLRRSERDVEQCSFIL